MLITGGDYGMQTQPMRAGLLKYLAKGMNQRDFHYAGRETVNIMDFLGVEHRGTPLPVPIKREGCSETINAKARSRAGWTELRSMSELHAALHPPKRPARFTPCSAPPADTRLIGSSGQVRATVDRRSAPVHGRAFVVTGKSLDVRGKRAQPRPRCQRPVKQHTSLK